MRKKNIFRSQVILQKASSQTPSSLMTRETLVQQLDTLRRHGRRTLVWCWVVMMLVSVPVYVYGIRLMRLVRAHSMVGTAVDRNLALFVLTLFAAWFVVFLICVVSVKRSVARHAPVCPFCSGRIDWREQNTVLASGRCPHCKCELFPSG